MLIASLITFILLFTICGTIILFGDLPNYRGTIFHKLHILLVDKIFDNSIQNIIKFDSKLFNGFFFSPKVIRIISWTSGWIIPTFYIGIISECIKLFFKYTFPQILKYDTQTNWSLRLWLIIIPIITSNYVTFFLAVFTEAGSVSRFTKLDQEKLELEFPHDRLIYFKGTECRTCHINKPSRSKHCAVCDRCILMFDHHCIWLNNDVAYRNYRWFFTFLCSICLIFVYGGYLCYYSLWLFIHSDNASNRITKSSVIIKYWETIKGTTFGNEITGILFLFCLALLPVVGAFLGEHIWSIYLGVTTNEGIKWDYIRELINMDLLYELVLDDGSDKIYLILKSQGGWNNGMSFTKLEDALEFNDLSNGKLNKVEGWKDMENVYDRGFWRNFLQRMFPKKFD